MYVSAPKEWPTTGFINRLFVAGILVISFAAPLSLGELLTR